MWVIEKIIITKSGSQGEASVFLNTQDYSMQLILNKFIINLNNGADPIAIPKSNGTPIIDGAFSIYLKDMVLSIFQDSLKGKDIGMYTITRDSIQKT